MAFHLMPPSRGGQNEGIEIAKVTHHTLMKFYGDRLGTYVHFVYHKTEDLLRSD